TSFSECRWTCTIDVMTRASAFFFQAEDGIRDRNVTGVQTCALPISRNFAELGAGHARAMGTGGIDLCEVGVSSGHNHHIAELASDTPRTSAWGSPAPLSHSPLRAPTPHSALPPLRAPTPHSALPPLRAPTPHSPLPPLRAPPPPPPLPTSHTPPPARPQFTIRHRSCPFPAPAGRMGLQPPQPPHLCLGTLADAACLKEIVHAEPSFHPHLHDRRGRRRRGRGLLAVERRRR